MQTGLTITVRPARPEDAPGIGAVHVAVWRSAYPGILSDLTLAGMSAAQQAAYYRSMIRQHGGVFVAVAGADEEVVGFASVGRRRGSSPRASGGAAAGPGDGEIHTLYVLDDWRDRGIGRRLMRAGARRLAADGCRSAFLWVLSDNPSRWFYQRLGGRAVTVGTTQVGGRTVSQTAYLWDPIETLTGTARPR